MLLNIIIITTTTITTTTIIIIIIIADVIDLQIGYGRFDSKTSNDSQTIDRDIEDRLSKCQCRNTFNAFKVDDGKYKVIIIIY